MFCRMKTLCIKSNEKIYTHQQRLFSSVAGNNSFCDNIFPRISAYPKAILSNKIMDNVVVFGLAIIKLEFFLKKT